MRPTDETPSRPEFPVGTPVVRTSDGARGEVTEVHTAAIVTVKYEGGEERPQYLHELSG